MPSAARALTVTLAALAAAWIIAGGTLAPDAAVAVAASAAALVAAREHRHRDMALAAGIAAGASTIGLALLPVLLGTSIARRTVATTSRFFAAAAILVALPTWGTPSPHASLATLLPADLDILLPTIACGVAAWLAASVAACPPSTRTLDAAALLAATALPLSAPIGIEAMGLAVALLLHGTRPTLLPFARAANDRPLRLRAA